jgi:hypothetical protein
LSPKQIIENYVPHYYKELQKALQKLVAGFSKPIRVKAPFAQGRKFATLEEAAEAGLKGETDIAQLVAHRGIASAKATTVSDFLKEVSAQFGKKIDYDEVTNVLKSGEEVSQKVPRFLEGFAQSTAKQLQGVQLPKAIVDDIDSFTKIIASDESQNMILRVVDRVQNWWKGMVTGIVPAYHTTNLTGNVFNNWLGGVNSPVPYAVANQIQRQMISGKFKGGIKTAAGELDFKTISEWADELGVLNRGFYGADIEKYVGQELERGLRTGAGKLKNLAPTPDNLARGGRNVGRAIENNARLAHFVDKLQKGWSPEDAALSVKKYLFDYQELTEFERNVMKRFIPFYTWFRKNIPLQFEQMIKQPRKPGILPKAARAIEDEEARAQEEGLLPEYLRESFTFRTDKKDKKGNPIYMRVAVPWADFARITDWKDIVGSLTPILKIPAELYFNKEAYFGREIYKSELPRDLQTIKAPQGIPWELVPSPLKKFLNVKKTTYKGEERWEIDARSLYILKNVVLPRVFGEISKATAPETDITTKVFGGLTPFKTTPIDLEEQQYFKDLEKQGKEQQIINYLRTRGLIPEETPGKKSKKKGSFGTGAGNTGDKYDNIFYGAQ